MLEGRQQHAQGELDALGHQQCAEGLIRGRQCTVHSAYRDIERLRYALGRNRRIGARFTDGYADNAAVSRNMIARKPARLDFVEAASVPIIAVTARQMLFTRAGLQRGQRVLVHGALGNVGAYVVQLDKHAGIEVLATARPGEQDEIRHLGVGGITIATSPVARRPQEQWTL